MAKMTIPVRDMESIMSGTEAGSIQELMFGSILAVEQEKKPLVDWENKRIHIYLKSTSTSEEDGTMILLKTGTSQRAGCRVIYGSGRQVRLWTVKV